MQPHVSLRCILETRRRVRARLDRDVSMKGMNPLLIASTTRAVIALLVLLAGFGGMRFLESFRADLDKKDPEQLHPEVPVFAADAVDVNRQWQGYGIAKALDSAEVPARVSATVVSIPEGILEGASVKKGQLLAELDDADFKRQVEMVEQTLEELEGRISQLKTEEERLVDRIDLEDDEIALSLEELARVQKLFDRNSASQSDLDTARRKLIAARVSRSRTKEQLDGIPARRLQLLALKQGQEANLRLAKLDLERTRIVSPIDGIISQVDIEVGENLAQGATVARVLNLERMELPLKLPASSRKDVMVGDAVELQSTNEHHLICKADVARISPMDDQSSRTVTVYTVVDQAYANEVFGGADSDRLIMPGMYLRGTATSSQTQRRFIVPRRAIQNERIMVVREQGEDDKAEPIIVSVVVEIEFNIEGEFPQFGLPDKQWAVLRTPLGPGTLVVINTSDTLRDGLAVKPIIAQPFAADETPAETVETSTPDDSRINGGAPREDQP